MVQRHRRSKYSPWIFFSEEASLQRRAFMLILPSAPRHRFSRRSRQSLLEPLGSERQEKLPKIYFLTKVHEEGGFESNGKLQWERAQRMGSIKRNKVVCTVSVCRFREGKWEDAQAGKSLQLSAAMCPRSRNSRTQANSQGGNLAQQMENFLNLLN